MSNIQSLLREAKSEAEIVDYGIRGHDGGTARRWRDKLRGWITTLSFFAMEHIAGKLLPVLGLRMAMGKLSLSTYVAELCDFGNRAVDSWQLEFSANNGRLEASSSRSKSPGNKIKYLHRAKAYNSISDGKAEIEVRFHLKEVSGTNVGNVQLVRSLITLPNSPGGTPQR